MIKVTREQMAAVEDQRDNFGKSLQSVMKYMVDKDVNFVDRSGPINRMTTEQIVLAWHGHVEIEPEFVSFDEAMRASGSKNVWFYPKARVSHPILIQRNVELKHTHLGSYSLSELFNGEFVIERDNK